AAPIGRLELAALEQRSIHGIQHVRRDLRCLEHRAAADHPYSTSPLLELRALQHFLRLLEVRRELVADRLRQERQQVVADEEQRDCGRRLEPRNVEAWMVTRPAPMIRAAFRPTNQRKLPLEGRQVAPDCSHVGVVTVLLEPAPDLGGRDRPRLAWDQSEKLPLAPDRVRASSHGGASSSAIGTTLPPRIAHDRPPRVAQGGPVPSECACTIRLVASHRYEPFLTLSERRS